MQLTGIESYGDKEPAEQGTTTRPRRCRESGAASSQWYQLAVLDRLLKLLRLDMDAVRKVVHVIQATAVLWVAIAQDHHLFMATLESGTNPDVLCSEVLGHGWLDALAADIALLFALRSRSRSS